EFGFVGFANEVAAFHRPMLLSVGEQVTLVEHLDDGAGGDIGRGEGAGRIEIMTGALPYSTTDGAPVTERQHDGPIGQTGLDVKRAPHRDTVDGDFAKECGFLALRILREFLAGHLQRGTAGFDAESLAETRADENGVVP